MADYTVANKVTNESLLITWAYSESREFLTIFIPNLKDGRYQLLVFQNATNINNSCSWESLPSNHYLLLRVSRDGERFGIGQQSGSVLCVSVYIGSSSPSSHGRYIFTLRLHRSCQMITMNLSFACMSSGIIAAIVVVPVISVAVLVGLMAWCCKARRSVSKSNKTTETMTSASVYDDTVMQQSSAYGRIPPGERVSSDVRMQDSRAYDVGMMRQPTNNVPMYEVVT